jgi:hypothetical protein
MMPDKPKKEKNANVGNRRISGQCRVKALPKSLTGSIRSVLGQIAVDEQNDDQEDEQPNEGVCHVQSSMSAELVKGVVKPWEERAGNQTRNAGIIEFAEESGSRSGVTGKQVVECGTGEGADDAQTVAAQIQPVHVVKVTRSRCDDLIQWNREEDGGQSMRPDVDRFVVQSKGASEH